MVPDLIAAAWLGRGAKYRLSLLAAGRGDWFLPLSAALAKHRIPLNGATGLRGVVDAFRGRVFYESDPLLGLLDTVQPPIWTLDRGAGDCDDLAWLHAGAVEYALGARGWRGLIVSYLARPWVRSHHFAAAVDPEGRIRAIEPQPRRSDPLDIDIIVPASFASFAAAAVTVAGLHQSEVVAYDVRDAKWGVIESWRRAEA